MASKRSWEPRSYPVRDPRSASQQVGRIVNPPRYMKLAGRGEKRPLKVTAVGNGVGPVSDRGAGR